MVLGEAALQGNGNEQKPVVFLQVVSFAHLFAEDCWSWVCLGFFFWFYFFEAELSVFCNGLLCFCAEEGQGLNLDAFIIDSVR